MIQGIFASYIYLLDLTLNRGYRIGFAKLEIKYNLPSLLVSINRLRNNYIITQHEHEE